MGVRDVTHFATVAHNGVLGPAGNYRPVSVSPLLGKPKLAPGAQGIDDLGRSVYLVGDGSYATYELMGKSIDLGVGLIVRMRMDAHLFHFPSPPVKGKRGPKPKIGKRIMEMTR